MVSRYLIVFIACVCIALPCFGGSSDADVNRSLCEVKRGIPEPLEGNIGNLYIEGQEVTVKAPADLSEGAVGWQIFDDSQKKLGEGKVEFIGPFNAKDICVGKLGIGWYKIKFIDCDGDVVGWTTAAVLAKLKVATAMDSPVCIDMATAWFAKKNTIKQEQLANLATLAGINWGRDRISWSQMEPEKGKFAKHTDYDISATVHAKAGLKTLQVFHDKPKWSEVVSERHGRFPADLRDVYRFCKEMAVRFKGRVQAWEPWNEANAGNFGGQTIDEMCYMQKAAYLGFKAGDPDLIVGWNAYGGISTDLHTKGVLANEAWSYFDTYNFHTYSWAIAYNDQWKPVREAACGKPIWLTESDRGLPSQVNGIWCDFDHKHEMLKAEFMAQSYSSSLFAGVNRHFHFILGHYANMRTNKIQFGLLRLDLTPRASYVALAAMGRLLNGAKCLGRWDNDGDSSAHVYAFSAKPDGKDREVLVGFAQEAGGWDQKGTFVADWPIEKKLKVEAVYDYLGRYVGKEIPAKLTGKAVFVILKKGQVEGIKLEKQQLGELREDEVCEVVLQLRMPRSTTKLGGPLWTIEPDHVIGTDVATEVELWAYNFGDVAVTGEVIAERIPKDFKLEPGKWDVTIEPMGRVRLPAMATIRAKEKINNTDNWFTLRGDFGDAGNPVLAFRLLDKWEQKKYQGL